MGRRCPLRSKRMAEIPLHLPLWYLLNTTQTGADSIVSGTGSAGAKVVLVFQTEAQAKARVKSKPIFRTIPISDQAGLEAFLDTAEQKEFTHVGIHNAAAAGPIVPSALVRRN